MSSKITRHFPRNSRVPEIIIRKSRSVAKENNPLRNIFCEHILGKEIDVDEVLGFVKEHDIASYRLAKIGLEEIAKFLEVQFVRKYDPSIDGPEMDKNRLYFGIGSEYPFASVSVHLPLFDSALNVYSFQAKSPAVLDSNDNQNSRERQPDLRLVAGNGFSIEKDSYSAVLSILYGRFNRIRNEHGLQQDSVVQVPGHMGAPSISYLTKESRFAYRIKDCLLVGSQLDSSTPTEERFRMNIQRAKDGIEKVNKAYEAFCRELQAR